MAIFRQQCADRLSQSTDGWTSVLGQELRNCIVDFLWMIELQVMSGLWKSEDASNVQTVSDSSRH